MIEIEQKKRERERKSFESRICYLEQINYMKSSNLNLFENKILQITSICSFNSSNKKN